MKNSKKDKENAQIRARIIILSVTALVAVAVTVTAIVSSLTMRSAHEGGADTDTVGTDTFTEDTSPFAPVDTEIIIDDTGEETQGTVSGFTDIGSSLENTDIGSGMTIVSIGTYSGRYIENGDDCDVENVMSIVVRNDSDKNIQYAEISIAAGEDFYNFTLSTLPKGSSVLLLEIAKKQYDGESLVRYALSDNVAVFPGEMDLMKDRFTVSGTDSNIMITNDTDADFKGSLTVYFKQTKDGQYFGGITYSATVRDGIKAGKSVIIPSDHFRIDTSKLMFVTVNEENS